jgi:hypothetical protein
VLTLPADFIAVLKVMRHICCMFYFALSFANCTHQCALVGSKAAVQHPCKFDLLQKHIRCAVHRWHTSPLTVPTQIFAVLHTLSKCPTSSERWSRWATLGTQYSTAAVATVAATQWRRTHVTALLSSSVPSALQESSAHARFSAAQHRHEKRHVARTRHRVQQMDFERTA